MGLDAVPDGDWFCSVCEARREVANRRDAILHRVWSVPSSGSDTESVGDDDDWSMGNAQREDSRGGSSNSDGDSGDEDDAVTVLEVVRRSRASGATVPPTPSVPRASSGSDVPAAEREGTSLTRRDSSGSQRGGSRGGRSSDVNIAGAVAGPNLWPRVLGSAAAVAAPRHSFFETAEGEEESSSEEDEGGDGGGRGRSVVEQSFADATRAAEVRC